MSTSSSTPFERCHRPAILVIVGDGPDRSRLERHAEASEPGWPVHFTGRISDSMLDRWFAHAKIVTSASDHEAFGLTLAEGLASGARVVASAIPAHARTRPPGRCGRSGHSRRPAGCQAVHRLARGSSARRPSLDRRSQTAFLG